MQENTFIDSIGYETQTFLTLIKQHIRSLKICVCIKIWTLLNTVLSGVTCE